MTWRCIRIWPFLSKTVKCVAPGDLGTITRVFDESAMTFICSGLPIMMLPASSCRCMSSDLSGVIRTSSCVGCSNRRGAL